MASGGPPPGCLDDDTDCILKVSGLTPAMNESDLELVFENERKSGGGEIQALEVDAKNGFALLTYMSQEVALRVLSRGTVTFCGSKLIITRHKKLPRWDSRTVHISGVTSGMSADDLELIYESAKKSGGGPVHSIDMQLGVGGAHVTFERLQDAENVLKQEYVYLEEADLILWAQRPHCVGAGFEPDVKKARVSGIQSDMTGEVLRLLFDSKKRSGGGAIQHMDLDRDTQSAVVAFELAEDAERVLGRKRVEWHDQVLTVSPVAQTASQSTGASSSGSYQQSSAVSNGKVCLVVSGITPNTTEEHVRMFFENAKTSRGGDIEDSVMHSHCGLAILMFKDNSVVGEVMKYHTKAPLELNKSRLTVSQLPLTYFGDSLENVKSRCILVSELPSGATEEGLTIWFENARTCGGGKLENCYLNNEEHRAVLTYRKAKDAENVFRRFKSSGFDYDGCRVSVTLLQPTSLPPMPSEHWEKHSLYIQNVPTGATSDCLKTYFNRLTNCTVDQVAFGDRPGVVLVTFSRMPELGRLYQLVCQKPLQETMLEIACVKQSRSVQVLGVGDWSKQKLQTYFEHTRSHGGPVEDIQLRHDQHCAIVTFVDRKDALQVVNKQTHIHDKRTLQTPHLYYDCMGIVPAVQSTTHSPPQNSPKAVPIDGLDSTLVAFLCSNQSAQAEISDALAPVHTQIEWPTTESSNVTLKCTLKKGSSGFQQQVQSWERIAHEAFNLVVSQFRVTKFPIGKVAWKEFVEEIQPVCGRNGDCDIKYDKQAQQVLVVGRKKSVESAMVEILEVHNKMAAVTEKGPVTDERTKLAKYKLHLLQVHDFPQQMARLHRDMVVQIDVDSESILMKGAQADIDKVKIEMYETLNNVETEVFPYSPIMCELLSTDTMRDRLCQMFKQKHLKIYLDVDVNEGLQIYATNLADIEKGHRVVNELAKQVTVRVREGSDEVLMTHEWMSLKEHLTGVQHPGVLVLRTWLDRKGIDIAAAADVVRQVEEKVKQFLEENTILKSILPMEHSYVRYILRHRDDELQLLRKKKTVQVEPTSGRQQTGFSISGNTDDMKQAKAVLNTIKSELKKKVFIPEQKTIGSFFDDDSGKHLLKDWEETQKVIIEVDDTAGSSLGSKMHHCATATLSDGALITVALGDITEYTGDAIVNAANDSMAHSGGIAKAIVDRGGWSIQDECKQYVAQHGKVPTGEACVSESGTLPCRKVIHTVGPIWKGGRNNEHTLLRRAIDSSLDLCTMHGLCSVAFPAVSAGIYGFPLQDACQIIVGTIRDRLEGGASPVTEVVLIDTVYEATEGFCQALTVILGRHRVQLSSELQDPPFQATFPGHLTPVDGDQFRGREARPLRRSMSQPDKIDGAKGGFLWISKGVRNMIMTSECITVRVMAGSLTKYQVDVMVNLTSRELKLTHGAVSKSLLNDAGVNIQLECNQKYPGGIQYGGFAYTKGYNLPCQCVYHGSCERYRQGNATKNMSKFISKCLQSADQYKMKSIAFPSLGTGSLGFPSGEIANIMYEEIKTFSKAHPKTTLQDVFIVVFQDSIRKVFEDEMQELLKTKVRQLKKSPSRLDKFKAGVKSLVGKGRQKPPQKKLRFCITGTSKQEYQIDQAIDKLKQTCKNEVTVKVFNSEQDQNNIRKLTRGQLERIKSYETAHQVAIEIESFSRNCSIIVEGRHQNISEVIVEIHKIFRDTEMQEQEQYQMEIIARLVQWKFEENGKFVDYPLEINALIEKAHAGGKPKVNWPEDDNGRTRYVEINFAKEMEVGWNRGRRVQRKTPESLSELPSTWSPMTGRLLTVTVDQKSAEYANVQRHFFQSMQAHGTTYTKIVKLTRIQNPVKYQMFEIHRQRVEQANKKGVKTERLLWHGTKPNVVDEINANGFDRSFNTSSWYGKGVYFATEAGLSAGSYTAPDANGHKYVYRARVLTGEYTKGHQTMIVPPPKDPRNKSIKYDSVVDNVQSPNEWVVFTDTSAYPEYLIQFH